MKRLVLLFPIGIALAGCAADAEPEESAPPPDVQQEDVSMQGFWIQNASWTSVSVSGPMSSSQCYQKVLPECKRLWPGYAAYGVADAKGYADLGWWCIGHCRLFVN